MDFIPVQTYDNYVSAHIAMGRLEVEGFHCWLKDENTVTIDPILTNAVGGIKLMVAAPESEKAAGILRSIDSQAKSLHPCPVCSSHNIELVTTPRKASNWFQVIIGLFLTNYAMPGEKVFHCFNCGHEFEITGTPENIKEETN